MFLLFLFLLFYPPVFSFFALQKRLHTSVESFLSLRAFFAPQKRPVREGAKKEKTTQSKKSPPKGGEDETRRDKTRAK